MAGFRFPEMKWNALFLLWPPPHRPCQDPRYHTAEPRWCPEPPKAASDRSGNRAHGLGAVEEALRVPGREPACGPEHGELTAERSLVAPDTAGPLGPGPGRALEVLRARGEGKEKHSGCQALRGSGRHREAPRGSERLRGVPGLVKVKADRSWPISHTSAWAAAGRHPRSIPAPGPPRAASSPPPSAAGVTGLNPARRPWAGAHL